jgi:ribosomal-protein-alanine N-acetyltransferase
MMAVAGEPRIVVASQAHIQVLAAIHADAFPEGERWSAEVMSAQLALPGGFGVLADEGGMLLARTAADEAEILTLAVAQASRRRGLARALVRAAMEMAASRGATAMFLEVAAHNEAARALYEGLGFVRVGLRRFYYPNGADALVLRAVLPHSGLETTM